MKEEGFTMKDEYSPLDLTIVLLSTTPTDLSNVTEGIEL